MINNVSVIILAAGHSERMKTPKPFLLFDEKRSFLDKITKTYISAGIQDIILVISPVIEERVRQVLKRNYPAKHIRIVVNPFQERGRFYSFQLGLDKAGSSNCFLQNIDNPFVTGKLLIAMGKLIRQGYCVVPVFGDKKGHPVLVSAEVVNHCRKLEGYEYNIREQLAKFPEIKLEWRDENILANINSADQYKKYFTSCEVFMK